MMLKAQVVLLVAISSLRNVGAKLIVGKHENGGGRNLTTRLNRKMLEWNDDNNVAYPRVSFSKNSCKNLSKDPCRPSSMPSNTPTVSPEPTTSPSFKPTRLPTKKPSAAPTHPPSVAPLSFSTKTPTLKPTARPTASSFSIPAPSKAPTPLPSLPPTPKPTAKPTARPTLKVEPTKTPATSPTPNPTPSPTKSPTKGPTKSPTKGPSSNPTKSPTRAPTKMPSKSPTRAPSTSSPTSKPISPSTFPSMAPSAIIQISDGDGTVSTCSNPPLEPGSAIPQFLAFQYNMYVPPLADVSNATTVMETRLHKGLVDQFLSCDFNDRTTSFHILSIGSSPPDEATSEVCDTSNDPVPTVPTECIVVIAELSMIAFFPDRRRLQKTVGDPVVLDSIGDFLNESMANNDFVGDDIVQVSYQGFVNVQTDSVTTAPGTDVNGVVGVVGGGSGDDDKNSKVAVGSAVVGVAALLLLIVTVLTVRRGRRRQDAYLRHLDDLASSGSDDHSFASNLLADGRVHLVRAEEEYVDFFSVESGIEDELPASHPDVHYCASATCPICKHRVMAPTFLSTSLSEEDNKDLSPRKSKLLNLDRHYMAPDTVNL